MKSFNYALLLVLTKQSETTMQWLQKFEQKIICDEKFRRNIERVFCCCRDLKTAETFSKFNKREVWKIFENLISGGCVYYRPESKYLLYQTLAFTLYGKV